MPAAARPPLFPIASRLRLVRTLALAALVLAFGAHAAEPFPDRSPDAAARRFYDRVIALRVFGAPDRNQQRQLAPAISSELARALRAADDAERAHRKASRDREAPLFEGDLFTSLFEGAREANVERCLSEGDHAQCIVSLTYRDHFGATQRWQDRAILVRERERWVVDDVAYEARWTFGNKGTLRAQLREAAPQAASRDAPGAGRKPSAKARPGTTSKAKASRARGK